MWWKILLIAMASLIILAILLINIDIQLFNRKVNNDLKTLAARNLETQNGLITEEDIKLLPEPVQRYLRYTQVIGTSRIGTVKLQQKGYIRQAPDQPWAPFVAEQYCTTNPPSFVWIASMKAFPLLSIKARDMYLEGKGNMYVKLPPFVTIADARGPEIDQGSLLRYLGEIVWFPTAYLSEYIQWEPIDNSSARIIMNYQGMKLPATAYFNEAGEMTSFVARRYAAMNGGYQLEDWAVTMAEYQEFNGIRIPTKAEIIWKLSSGDFSPIKLEVTELVYDDPSLEK